jgi:DNA-binding protein YbaB
MKENERVIEMRMT